MTHEAREEFPKTCPPQQKSHLQDAQPFHCRGSISCRYSGLQSQLANLLDLTICLSDF